MRISGTNAGMNPCSGRWRSFATLVVGLLASLVTIGLRAQQLQDHFTNRLTFTSATGELKQSNQTATLETGEPRHGGKSGGRSLWLSWIAPSNGYVKFQTDDSDFDTTLGVYQFTNPSGTTFAELREVARADDSEGHDEESEVEFGVFAGEQYEIAVDGYFGAAGDVDLSWEFTPLPGPPAKVLSSPPDRAVNLGETVTLSVTVTNAAGADFKWYLGATELEGPTASTTNLVIPNFQATNVGRYKFRVNFGGGLQYFSVPAELQINTEGSSNTLAQGKVLDTELSPLLGGSGGSSLRSYNLVRGGGGLPRRLGVVRGYNGSQVFNTAQATSDPLEPPHCNVPGGSSYWLLYQPPTNGLLTLDTVGSSYDTVLEAFTVDGPLTGYQDLIPLACDNDAFGTNGPARVQFSVARARRYVIAVDGVNAAFGVAWLNYKLDTNQPPLPPMFTHPPAPRTVAAGTTVTLTAPLVGLAPMTLAWRKENLLLPGQTGASLILPNVTRSSSGRYTISATNDLGFVVGEYLLSVVVPPQCSLAPAGENLVLSFLTETGQTYRVEIATNLTGPWLPWAEALPGTGLIQSHNFPKDGSAFYRVRVE